MSILSLHISHLLWHDGQTSVPGIGVFRLVRSCAAVGDTVLSAPSTRVVFEPLADAEADALVASVCRREGLDESAGRRFVEAECASLAASLEAGFSLDLPRIGTLTADAITGELCFSVAGAASVLPSLPALSIAPLAVPEPPSGKQIEEAAGALARRRDEFERLLRRTASSAAAIAMFALVAFVVSQLPSRNSVRQQASMAMQPFEEVQSCEEPVASAANVEPALVLILNTPADASAPAKQRYKKAVPPDAVEVIGRYCLVVASLASEQEAMSYIRTHSTTGMPLRLLAEDGRWRVFALSGDSFDEVNAIARNLDVYSLYPSAWICRR